MKPLVDLYETIGAAIEDTAGAVVDACCDYPVQVAGLVAAGLLVAFSLAFMWDANHMFRYDYEDRLAASAVEGVR